MPKNNHIRNIVISSLVLIILAFALGFYWREVIPPNIPNCIDLGGLAFSNAYMNWRDVYPGRYIPNDMANPYIHVDPSPIWNFGSDKVEYHYQIVYFLIDGTVKIIEGNCYI